ncbi:MAG: histidine phosphatase family protein [Dermatophilaceae bacterium]
MRHAETVDNAARVWQGHADTELSEVGRAQVTSAAPFVAAYQPALLISSDLKRAAATADAVAMLTGLELRLDARLREVDVGQWQGLSADEVTAGYPELIAALDRGEDVPKGVTGETRAEVADRAGAAVRDIVRELGPGEVAVVVAHGVSARSAAADLVGLDQAIADRILRSLDNCHWIELVETSKGGSVPARWRIAGWNLGPPIR